jgi:hypothetical protein
MVLYVVLITEKVVLITEQEVSVMVMTSSNNESVSLFILRSTPLI